VAIYELTNRDNVPRQVVVNEAVELASMFGSESSARFINGVLGSYLNDLSAA
jgi:N utilization substance protein B